MSKVIFFFTLSAASLLSGKLFAAEQNLYCASVDERYTMVVETDGEGKKIAELFIDGESVEFGILEPIHHSGQEGTLVFLTKDLETDGYRVVVTGALADSNASLSRVSQAEEKFLGEMDCSLYPRQTDGRI